MIEGSFDLIAQGLLRQKTVMEQMLQENQELRSQLADLRAGRGIFIEIDGQRFSLAGESLAPQATSIEIPSVPLVEPVPTATQVFNETEELVPSTTRTSLPIANVVIEEVEAEQKQEVPTHSKEVVAGPTFLEEVMIDEFTAAATSPLAVWSVPTPTKEPVQKSEMTEEDELVMLRRQLIGSYLLE